MADGSISSQQTTPRQSSSELKAGRAASRIQRAFKRYKLDREKVKRNRREKGLVRPDNTSWAYSLKVVGLIATWYTLSTTLTVFNKAIYGGEHGKFPAPLLVTGSGMLLQFFLCRLFFFSYALVYMRAGFGEALLKCNPNLHTGEQGAPMTWGVWASRYAPVSFMTGLDYGASNFSLVFITLSFYTMCKSTSPLFLLMFAFLLRLEQPSFKLTGIMGVIMSGVMLSVYGEVHFHAFGFFLVMLAAFLSGWRWGYVQLLLQKGSWLGKGRNLKNSVITLYNMTPLMSGIVLFFSMIIERPWRLVGTSEYFSSFNDLMLTGGIISFTGTVAFLMVLAEFVLVAETTAVTLTVAGSLKELLTILAGIVFFGDRINAVNGAGLCILIIGVIMYNYYKLNKLKELENSNSKSIELSSLDDLENKNLLNDALPTSDQVFSLDDDEFDGSENGVV